MLEKFSIEVCVLKRRLSVENNSKKATKIRVDVSHSEQFYTINNCCSAGIHLFGLLLLFVLALVLGFVTACV
jgi:hypothetical protein